MSGTGGPDEVADEELDDEEFEGEWELDPNDPTHPDHELSESSSYAWYPPDKQVYLRRGVILAGTVLIRIESMIPVPARNGSTKTIPRPG